MIHLSNSFLEVIENPIDGTRPSRSVNGTAFSLGASNVMGAYTQFINGGADWPAGAGDGFGIYLEVRLIGVANQAHPALVTIGIDRAGGTTYTDWIENLIVCDAGANDKHYSYFFPIRVPNGCSLAIKGQDGHATPVASSYIRTQIFCKPTRPELVRVGTFVQSFGVDTATSLGVAVTQGVASEGTYAQLGAALDKPIWHWEFGVAMTTTAAGNQEHHVDIALGDASNKRRVIKNGMAYSNTSEQIGKTSSRTDEGNKFGGGAIGELVYGRVQSSGSNATMSLAAYGVGG